MHGLSSQARQTPGIVGAHTTVCQTKSCQIGVSTRFLRVYWMVFPVFLGKKLFFA
jgi:uncharacterized RDD family membrane protein YckC